MVASKPNFRKRAKAYYFTKRPVMVKIAGRFLFYSEVFYPSFEKDVTIAQN